MRIAVTYEDGRIFNHFGKTKQFKIYDVEGKEIEKCELITTDGEGHAAMAALLSEYEADVVICGGIGDEAAAALEEDGIILVSGVEGDTNQAVKDYLSGKLTTKGVNCSCEGNCSSDEGCGCSCDDECCGGCDEGGCGGGCGGCGMDPRLRPIMFEGKNAGKVVSVHYEGKLDDGTIFDSSYDRDEPLTFVCGTGMMIKGFDKAVVEMEIGEVRELHLEAEEAYGERDPKAILTVALDEIPGADKLNVGEHIVLSNTIGQRFPVVVSEKTKDSITFDANHELAGKALNFKVELVSIED